MLERDLVCKGWSFALTGLLGFDLVAKVFRQFVHALVAEKVASDSVTLPTLPNARHSSFEQAKPKMRTA